MSLLAQSQQWYPTHVKVVAIRARGLRNKGKDGTNDAYAIMQLGKEQYSSSVAEKTTAPLWREEAEFEMPPLQLGRADKSTLRLTVMHRALVGLDKFLGQAAISLSELYANKTRSKVGWYRLHSKAGKADKERGEIEADIQFVRNNMTASMFDLSAKDKSRSALGKLKDRLKGKKRDGFSDSASAIVPSLGAVGDSDEEDEATARAATTSRLRKLLPKSTLQRTSLSQSMSVIPTAPSSPHGNAKAGGFTEIRLDDSAGEESSGKGLQVPKILSHKRAASADNNQLDLALPGNPRKEPLSLLGGLRPKSDPVSQSNLCINGSHVYTEEPGQAVPSKPRPEPRSRFYTPSPEEDPRPETPPRGTADAPAPASVERGGGSPDPGVGRAGPAPEERVRSLNPFEANEEEEQAGSGEATPEEPRPQAKKEEASRGGLMSLFPKKAEAPKALEGKELRRTSEEGRGEVKKPASTSVWASRMAAIKPKLEVSPKAEARTGTSSSPPSFHTTQADPFSSAPPVGSRGPSSAGLGPLALQEAPSPRSPSPDVGTMAWGSSLSPLPNSSSSSSSSCPSETSEASIELSRQRAPTGDLLRELTQGTPGEGRQGTRGGRGSPGSPGAAGESSEGGGARVLCRDPSPTGSLEPRSSPRPPSSLPAGGAVSPSPREPPAVLPRGGAPKSGLPTPAPRGVPRAGPSPPPLPLHLGLGSSVPPESAEREGEPPDALELPGIPEEPNVRQEAPVARDGDPPQPPASDAQGGKMTAGAVEEAGLGGGFPETPAAPEPMSEPRPPDSRLEQTPAQVAAPSLLPTSRPPSPPAPAPSPPLLSLSSSPMTSAARSVNPPEPGISDRKRLPQAKVLPTETQPIESQSSESTVPFRCRPHPVKPMAAAEPKIHDVSSEENLKARLKVVDTIATRPSTGQAVTLGERLTTPKEYDPSDPAAAYTQLTHDELIQLVLKQKEIISKKDCHVQELENYIDNLLVRVMEETPSILRVSYQPPRKAERV
ncbi:rab11 family-interacting protein 1-like isoform X2 [Rhincodon typus]|uniref:rab11 family-interacting protein 1-like isoform X2 n=1 Tax=Rhincodon typus TaxID=259920 RepID=UPI00202EC399|nr:rab11 family-interacting protein 1-like isoform X2 [Rhincodon typus]